jgi:hypothetical protein
VEIFQKALDPPIMAFKTKPEQPDRPGEEEEESDHNIYSGDEIPQP